MLPLARGDCGRSGKASCGAGRQPASSSTGTRSSSSFSPVYLQRQEMALLQQQHTKASHMVSSASLCSPTMLFHPAGLPHQDLYILGRSARTRHGASQVNPMAAFILRTAQYSIQNCEIPAGVAAGGALVHLVAIVHAQPWRCCGRKQVPPIRRPLQSHPILGSASPCQARSQREECQITFMGPQMCCCGVFIGISMKSHS